MSQRFRALPGLAFTAWDEEVEAVYSPASATTHLLSADAATLLRLLMQCPQSMDARSLAEAIDADAANDLESEQLPKVDSQAVQSLLDGLYSAGLTHPHE